MLDQTGSAFMVGLLNFAAFFPMLVLGLVGGHYVDRWSSRRVLLVSQVASALISLALAGAAFAGQASPVVLLCAVAAQGVSYAFAKPATQAAIPALVPRTDLAPAIAMNSLAFTLGLAIGPVVAAVVLRTSGPGTAFVLDAFSYLILVFAALGLPVRDPGDGSTADGGLWRGIRDGLRFVASDHVLRVILFGMAMSTVAIEFVKTLMPVFSVSLGRPPEFAGVLVGLFGVGSLVGATVAPVLDRAAASIGVSVSLAVLSMAGLVFSSVSRIAATVPLLLLAGISFMTATVLMTAAFFRRVPPPLRGRALAIHSLSFLGVSPFAALASGVLAQVWGVRTAIAITSAFALVGAAAFVLPRQIDFQK
jgi:MFS family permease